ncbi:MAG: hypothetical protein IT531_06930 [Burkholderiales bacterium]|nr:hypothetical protein [Burkholderiales bacterium]
MAKKLLIASLLAGGFGAPAAYAAEQSAHTLTGNVGLYSQYIFRGLTQTDRDPALQGGFDYSHASGFYLGTWASNVSWLRDMGAYRSSGSLEWDFYGGFKSSIGKSDFAFDVGLLQYWYPGDPAAGFVKANTLEAYGALSWKWLSAKYSYSLDNKTFGVTDSRGTWYLDLTATIPVTDKLNLQAHWGRQKFRGGANACPAVAVGLDNDGCASYDDWKLGATYSLPRDFTIGAFFSGTDMDGNQKGFYTTPVGAGSRFLGKDAFTVFLQKTF